jgi:hypothetical protein
VEGETYRDTDLLNQTRETRDSSQSRKEVAVPKAALANGSRVGRTALRKENRLGENFRDSLDVLTDNAGLLGVTVQTTECVVFQVELAVSVVY